MTCCPKSTKLDDFTGCLSLLLLYYIVVFPIERTIKFTKRKKRAHFQFNSIQYLKRNNNNKTFNQLKSFNFSIFSISIDFIIIIIILDKGNLCCRIWHVLLLIFV